MDPTTADSSSGTEFEAFLHEIDTLASTPNPEATPYATHYRIIEIIQKWLTTPLPSLEAAVANAKLGATYLHVEEPHNAQPALERAASFFFPELLAFAASSSSAQKPATSGGSSSEPPPPTHEELTSLLANLPVVQFPSTDTAPQQQQARHVLELLNQMGILWFNRSQPLRALCFFKACSKLCAAMEEEQDQEKEQDLEMVVDGVRTHAYFYLAQVYGALHRANESALYCLATLELQLQRYTTTTTDHEEDEESAAQEWIKNALKLVDYYLEMENGTQAALCLDACEFMLQHQATAKQQRARAASTKVQDQDSEASGSGDDCEESQQRRAEMCLAWARLHQQSLALAQFRDDGEVGSASSSGSPPLQYVDSVVRQVSFDQIISQVRTTHSGASGDEGGEGGPLEEPPQQKKQRYIAPDQVHSFETAREIFKMASSACEQALQVFILDGFVTVHLQVVQLQSKLYKRLLFYENDVKRQIAMQLRRLALLSPLLQQQLNPQAYTAKLQELFYECGEIAVEIYDLKQIKSSTNGSSNTKTTTYLLKAIKWYQQYLSLFYSTTTKAPVDNAAATMVFALDGGAKTKMPLDGASMAPMEFKSVLHGYFSLARACSKVVLLHDVEKTVGFWKKSIEFHDSVLVLVKKYHQNDHKNGDILKNIFQAEMHICEEMIELLPEKINQLVYNGKAL